MKLNSMAEALRLTRAGRLTDATALLHGQDESAGRRPADGGPGAKAEPRETTRTRSARSPRFAFADAHARRSTDPDLPEGAIFAEEQFACAAGSRNYRLYVPENAAGGAPALIVMLHGCTQTAEDFAVGTRMNALAEEYGFLVAYPQQTRAANANGCWNWFEPGHQERGAGEPAIIAGLARQIAQQRGVDEARIYVAGLSAGGAAALAAASVYPDVFAAVGVHSGLAHKSAGNVASAFQAMRDGAPGEENAPPFPPVIVFHGDRDKTVSIKNASAIEAAATAGEPTTVIERVKGRSPKGRSFTQTVHRAPSGETLCESWKIHGGGHAWSGGDDVGTYVDPKGPDASREMARFFLDHRRG